MRSTPYRWFQVNNSENRFGSLMESKEKKTVEVNAAMVNGKKCLPESREGV